MRELNWINPVARFNDKLAKSIRVSTKYPCIPTTISTCFRQNCPVPTQNTNWINKVTRWYVKSHQTTIIRACKAFWIITQFSIIYIRYCTYCFQCICLHRTSWRFQYSLSIHSWADNTLLIGLYNLAYVRMLTRRSFRINVKGGGERIYERRRYWLSSYLKRFGVLNRLFRRWCWSILYLFIIGWLYAQSITRKCHWSRWIYINCLRYRLTLYPKLYLRL